MNIKMHTYSRSEWRDFKIDLPKGADVTDIVEALGFLTMPAFHIIGAGAGVAVYYPTLDNADIDSYLVRLWSRNGRAETSFYIERNRWITCTTLEDLIELLGKLVPIVKATGWTEGA